MLELNDNLPHLDSPLVLDYGSEAYGFIYNRTENIVARNMSLSFDSNAHLHKIVHTPGTYRIRIILAGIYLIRFSILSSVQSYWSLRINNDLQPELYSSGCYGVYETCHQGIYKLPEDTVLTIVNQTESPVVVLPEIPGDTENLNNASLLVLKLDSKI